MTENTENCDPQLRGPKQQYRQLFFPSAAGGLGQCPKMPRNRAEFDLWSPTDAEVDTYILRLEREVSQKDDRVPPDPGKICGGAAQIVRRWSSRACFFGGVIGIALVCFAWLFEAIYGAFK